ncbi:MAG: ATPase, T2SS/T4P/T4SS family [Acidobacteriaceae bacterium]
MAYDAKKRELYADARRAGDPLLQTWLVMCKSAGSDVRLVKADPDTISGIKERIAGEQGTKSLATVPPSMDMRQMAITLLKRAGEHNASDMHVLLRETHAEIQIRVKGRLRVMEKLPVREGQALSRAFFQGLATVKNSYNPLEFQDGQIAGEALKDTILSSVRLVRGPSYPVDQNCGFVVARLQYKTGRPKQGKTTKAYPYPSTPEGEIDLIGMGYTTEQAALMEEIASAPSGIVIISGPTGSGKTFTLNEVLKHVARLRPYQRLISIESPVEHPMSWAIQLQASESKTEDAFGDRLVTTLRADPDILLIGELRSAASAIPARDAAITGHMVWTTLHVDDPYMVIDRLEGMDRQNLNRQAICDHKLIRAMIGQRLVGQLCPDCSKPLADDASALPRRLTDALATWGDLRQVRIMGGGCETCGQDGIVGMRAVAEIVKTTPQLMQVLAKDGTSAARAFHRASGQAGKSLLENAIDLVFQGLLDPREVEEEVDVIESKVSLSTASA